MGNRVRSGYPSDVTDDEWSFVAPYLALCREDAPHRDYLLRDVFNALRYIAKTGCHWRMLPNDLPPWTVVYQQMRRWIDARCFEIMVEDLRILLREFSGRKGQPTAMILDNRTLQSTPDSEEIERNWTDIEDRVLLPSEVAAMLLSVTGL
jgi:transposase